MAEYTITTWHVDTITKVRQSTRRTRTSAMRAFKLAVYGALEQFGKLDTTAGHKVWAQACKADDLLPIGEQRAVTVSNTGLSVVVSRDA